MRRPSRTRRAATALALVPVAALLLAGCSRGLSVEPPAVSGVAAYTCAALHGALPDEVLGKTVTATNPRSPYTAAWGDPSIVLRCGVPTPAALTPTSQLITVDGVDWLPEQLTGGYLFTTVGRELNVEVSVPSAYAPEADALADLSSVVAKMDRVAGSASASPSAS